MGKKYGALIAFILVAQIFFCGNLFFGTKSYAKEFSDVPATHWAYEYVSSLTDKGVINGYEDGTFKPSNNITRAEFIKLMVSATLGEKVSELKSPKEQASATYSTTNKGKMTKEEEEVWKSLIARGIDLEKYNQEVGSTISYTTEWFAPYTYWAESNSIFNRSYSNEDYKSPISRGEMAQILNRFLVYKKIDTQIGDSSYTDLSNIDSDVQIAISIVSEAGLVKGYDDGSFKLDNNMTRAEIATIIYRYNELLNKI